MKVFCAAFMCLQFGFVIFWQKDFGAKAAHKMLVKLTPGYPWQLKNSHPNVYHTECGQIIGKKYIIGIVNQYKWSKVNKLSRLKWGHQSFNFWLIPFELTFVIHIFIPQDENIIPLENWWELRLRLYPSLHHLFCISDGSISCIKQQCCFDW